MERWPFAGAVGVTLMEPVSGFFPARACMLCAPIHHCTAPTHTNPHLQQPHLEFELPLPASLPLAGGLDLLALPGVRGVFRLGLRLASRQFLVFPK